MAILGSFAEFRRYFSREVEETASFTFDNATGRVTRASGSFLSMPSSSGGAALAMQSGSILEVTGTASNNHVFNAIEIAASYVRLGGSTVTNEGPVSCTIRAVPRDNDDLPTWPVSDVRGLGFDGGITGMSAPYTGGTITLTANSTTADSVAGTDEYHWYLSQRTDDPAKQLWLITPYVDGTANTYSGSVILGPSALNLASYDLSIDSEDLSAVLRNVHIYCLRVLDGAIQWLDLFRAAQGAT